MTRFISLLLVAFAIIACKGPEFTHYTNRFTAPMHDLVTTSPLREVGDHAMVLSVITVEVINVQPMPSDYYGTLGNGDTCELFYDSGVKMIKIEGKQLMFEYIRQSDGSRYGLAPEYQCPVGTRFIVTEADYIREL